MQRGTRHIADGGWVGAAQVSEVRDNPDNEADARHECGTPKPPTRITVVIADGLPSAGTAYHIDPRRDNQRAWLAAPFARTGATEVAKRSGGADKGGDAAKGDDAEQGGDAEKGGDADDDNDGTGMGDTDDGDDDKEKGNEDDNDQGEGEGGDVDEGEDDDDDTGEGDDKAKAKAKAKTKVDDIDGDGDGEGDNDDDGDGERDGDDDDDLEEERRRLEAKKDALKRAWLAVLADAGTRLDFWRDDPRGWVGARLDEVVARDDSDGGGGDGSDGGGGDGSDGGGGDAPPPPIGSSSGDDAAARCLRLPARIVVRIAEGLPGAGATRARALRTRGAVAVSGRLRGEAAHPPSFPSARLVTSAVTPQRPSRPPPPSFLPSFPPSFLP